MFSRVQHNPSSSSRKRRKMAHATDESPVTTSTKPDTNDTITSTAKTLPVRVGDDAQEVPQSTPCCEHETALQKLEPDIESMRQLITCKICQRYLTEPYNLACGHTYCYICLDTWLISQKKRTCPECRARVWKEPVPSYIIKELVSIFSNRTSLLPEGETIEDLQASAKEAADKVAEDRGVQGDKPLFKGLFKNADQHVAVPYHDEEDNVFRCPFCGHEIEDGSCSNPHCVHHDASFNSDDAFGTDLSDEDSESSDGVGRPYSLLDHQYSSTGLDDSEEDDEDDDDDPDMGDFIDDAEDDEDDEDGHGDLHSPGDDSDAQEGSTDVDSSSVNPVRTARRRARPIVIASDSDDEGSHDTSDSQATTRQAAGFTSRRRLRSDTDASATSFTTTGTDYDTTSTAAQHASGSNYSPRTRTRGRPIVIDDDEDEDEDDDEQQEEDLGPNMRSGRFIIYSDDEVEQSIDDTEHDHDDEEDDEEGTEVTAYSRTASDDDEDSDLDVDTSSQMYEDASGYADEDDEFDEDSSSHMG